MAKPRSVLEFMTVTLLKNTNKDGRLAGQCSNTPILWFRPGVDGSVHLPREAAWSNIHSG